MANTERRAEYTDRSGKMFIPINVEGGTYNENFITTPKLITLVMIILTLFVIITYLANKSASILSYIIHIGIWAFFAVNATRFIIFEEKFYFRMFKERKHNEVTTPAFFWNIASIRDTDGGAIMTYSDSRIAAILKVERDTITGKTEEFRELHYDSISDFYKQLAAYRLNFIHMNIMEPAGNDPRIPEISKVVHKSSNPNLRALMELMVGHIKNITRSSLYEMDYFLIYTPDSTRVDTLIKDINDSVIVLLNGAYAGYRILTKREIADMVKEEYNVKYFNITQASLYMFKQNSEEQFPPFNITGIIWDDNVSQELTPSEVNRLKEEATLISNGDIPLDTVDIKSKIYKKRMEGSVGVSIDAVNEKVNNFKEREQKQKFSSKLNKLNKGASKSVNVEETVTNNELYGNSEIINDDLDGDDEYIDL